MSRRFVIRAGQVILFFAWTLVPLVAVARAELHFAQPAVDAGVVRCGAPLSHRFLCTNRGNAAVEIIEARAGCGCLTPRLTQRVFEPGESGGLQLEINTLSQEEGPHTWTCRLLCQSEGKRFEVPLQIAGRVITEVKVRPAVLTLFTDSAVAHELVLTDVRPQPLTVTELRATSSRLRPRLSEPGKDAEGRWVRRIRLEVAPDCPEGRHDETLHILTSDPLYRDLKVPVTVVKRPRQRVTALPAEVKVEGVADQPLPSRLLRLRDSRNEAIIVERITADDPAISCTWASGPETQATVKVRVERTGLKGDGLDSAIHITLRQPVGDTITVPVKCLLLRP